jgi:aminomethyltransferase
MATILKPPADYRAALEGAAYMDEGAAGRIFMRGRDRAALLHRLSTNDIERLTPGQGARTVLTTPIGRIIDLLAVHALDDALLLVTSPEQGPPVYGHLRRNIFFNDQVTLEAAGRSHGQLALFGPAASDLLARLGAPGLADLAPHHTRRVEVAGVAALLAARPPIGGQGFTLYVPAESLETVRESLAAGGAVPLGAASLDVLRVERGYGAFGRELSQEYIPLETGLLDAVSFTKGCYVGQEIIARMESRGRLAKRLVGLRLTTDDRRPTTDDRRPTTDDRRPTTDERRPEPALSASEGTDDRRTTVGDDEGLVVGGRWSFVLPAKLAVGGKDAGDLTSAVVSPRLGPIALAYVRTAHAEPGTVVGVAGGEVSGEVVELPFL